MKIKKNILVVVFLAIIIFLSGFLYRDSFSAYFFQDDWFSLRISNAKNFAEVLGFFIPRRDVIYYRPLGMQLPFFILEKLFGINPLPFHLTTFFTHSLNIILVFLLVNSLLKNKTKSILISFLYAVSLVHYTPFFWSATYAFVLGPIFFFLAFFLFILFTKNKKILSYIFSILFFVLGLLTNELVIALPVILLLYLIIMANKVSKKYLVPLFFVGIFFLIFRFLLFPPPITSQYQLGIDKHIVKNLQAYFLWSLNWPEEMKAQFVSFFTVSPGFIRVYKNYFSILLASLIISFLSFYVLPAGFLVYQKNWKISTVVYFGLFWFLVGILPVLFFPDHNFTYYLPIALVGLLTASVELFSYLIQIVGKFNKYFAYLLVFLVIINWFYASFASIEFNSGIHWAPRRAVFSKNLKEKAKKLYPPKNTDYPYIYVKPDSEMKLALNDQDGYKVIFADDQIETVYKNIISKNLISGRD